MIMVYQHRRWSRYQRESEEVPRVLPTAQVWYLEWEKSGIVKREPSNKKPVFYLIFHEGGQGRCFNKYKFSFAEIVSNYCPDCSSAVNMIFCGNSWHKTCYQKKAHLINAGPRREAFKGPPGSAPLLPSHQQDARIRVTWALSRCCRNQKN